MPFPSTPTVSQLTVSSVPFRCPAWWTLDLSPLWLPPDMLGDDVPMPGVTGAVPRRRRYGVGKVVLEMRFVPDVEQDGTPIVETSNLHGLEQNLADFVSTVVEPVASTEGTRPAVLTMPSGATRTGGVHVESFEVADMRPTGCRAAITLSIPGGKLT